MGTRLLLGMTAAMLTVACTATRDVQKDLQLVDISTGWFDAGVVDGQNKLVPSVTLKVKNVSAEEIERVQLNAIFRRVDEPQSWGEHFVRAIDTDGLAAGATTDPLVLRSPRGYTGTQSRAQMLQNREFVDAKVDIFCKHGSRWVKMGEFPVERTVLTK